MVDLFIGVGRNTGTHVRDAGQMHNGVDIA
jgi:hypothetical protein